MSITEDLVYKEFSYVANGVHQKVELALPGSLEVITGDEGVFHLEGGGRDVWLNLWPDRPAKPNVDIALSHGGRIHHRLPFEPYIGADLQSLIPAYATLVFGIDTSSWRGAGEWHIFEIGGWALKSGASKGDFVESMFFTPPGCSKFTLNILTARREENVCACLCMLSTTNGGYETSSDWRWFEHMRKPLLAGEPVGGALFKLPGWALSRFGSSLTEQDIDSAETALSSVGVEDVIRTISSDDSDERADFIMLCPPCSMKESAVTAARMTMPEMRAQALDLLAGEYANTGPYDVAAKLGEATYRLAKSMYQQGGRDRDTTRMIAGRGAINWVAGLKQLGEQEKALRVIKEPIEWLTQIEDTANLPMLQQKRIEIELDLERYDNAEAHLTEVREDQLPQMVRVSFRALKTRLEKHKGGGTELPGEYPEYTDQDLAKILTGNTPSQAGAPITPEKADVLEGAANVLISQFFGGKSGSLNEFTVRQQIIKANSIFMDSTKGRDPDEIAKVIPVLIHGRDWMRKNNFPDSENDAQWGLYLAYSRTHREADAVNALQALRANIERARGAIADPLERSRLSARYPYLYPSLAKMLCATGDVEALFEAIEASKGRVLADLQTQRRGEPASEAEFARAIRGLPTLLKQTGCTYITYLIDDDETFAVLVNRNGDLSKHEIKLGVDTIRSFARWRDPRLWLKRDPTTLERVPSIAELLSPFVAFLNEVAQDTNANHICYSPSGPLLSLPLHCAHLNGKALVKRFSVSRVHGAASLYQLLSDKPTRPTGFLSLEVPAIQDLHNAEKMAAWEKAGAWLQKTFRTGVRLRSAAGDAPGLAKQATEERVVHFATHGTFPETPELNRDPNPYRSSGVVLAANGKLPDLSGIFQDGENLLSPNQIVDMRLDFSRSHVTLEACVTGLAKTSVGGDALGLEFALLQLGAQSVLSTHWNANVNSMGEFLVAFYTHWLVEENTRADSWRRAVLDHAQKYGDNDEGAYHWGAFSLTGDWR